MAHQLLHYRTEGFEIRTHRKVAVIFGASGKIGNACLRRLLTHQAYEKVISIGRRPLKATHPKLIHYEVDLLQPDQYRHLMTGDDLFIAIGTTIKSAGSKEAFFQIDHDLIFSIAKSGALQNMNQLILVSSLGADSSSLVYYLKVKGELEDDVRRLPFWGIHIMRPGFVMEGGENAGWLQKFSVSATKNLQFFSGSIIGDLAPIDPDIVARYMVHVAQQLKGGTQIHFGSEMVALVKKL